MVYGVLYWCVYVCVCVQGSNGVCGNAELSITRHYDP